MEPFLSVTNRAIVTKPLKPSPVTSGPHLAAAESEYDAFELSGNLQDDYEIRKTAVEADQELKELFQGAMQDEPTEIDMDQAIVDGFGDGIVLKPHQVSL